MELLQTKSLLAKLMATENLHIEQRNVGTASFDVESRILTIPVLDKKISAFEYDLFLGHEVGHALYTPLDGLNKAFDLKLSMSVMNVLEDSRIERKIKTKYPGIRQSFIRAYKELAAKDFFGTDGVDLNQMNFIDRVNLYCKIGIDTNIVFSDDEKVLLDEIESTQTYDDVIEVCKKVSQYMKDEKKENPKRPGTGDPLDYDEEEDEEDSEKGRSEEYETGEGDESDDAKQSSEDDESDDESEESVSDYEDDQQHNGRGQRGSSSSEPVSYTDEAYRQNESRLFSADARKFYYGNVPDIDLDETVVDHKALWKRYHKDVTTFKVLHYGKDSTYEGTDVKAFQKLREDSKKVVSYLVKEFELRKNADQMSRASISNTGELNMSKIFSYKFNEDLFKKVTVVPGGKSHGLVMFVDWSGSMSNHIENTIRQLLNLVMFCKKVNIPYEVYAFSTGYDLPERWKRIDSIGKKDDMYLCDFKLFNLLSSRMNTVEYAYAASALLAYHKRGYHYKPDWFDLAGTPLNEAIVAAMKIVPQFQKRNKLQVVNTVFLTDGDGQRSTEINNGAGGHIVQTGSRCVVIRDPITKHEVLVESRNARKLTAAYIELLKARTNCNIVGFYVLTSREFGQQATQLGLFKPGLEDISVLEKMKVSFRNNKYQVITSAGYDEYYLLRAESLDTEEDAEFEVRKDATTRGFVTAFSKFSNNRKTSRVVLNRFIGMII